MWSPARVVRHGRRRTARHLVTVVVSSTLLIGARNARAQARDSVVAQQAWMADSLRRDSLLARLGPQLQRIGRVFWDIPEYHDEQRFVTGTTYGPVVNIFASPMLDGFTETWQIEEQGIPGLLVAVVFVDAPAGTTLPAEYSNLSLVPGINCLWLSYASGTWKGRVSAATASAECDPSQPMSMLVVKADKHPMHPSHADYPPVGRFTEAVGGQPLLATQCLSAWCNFGPIGGFTVLASSAGNSGREDRIMGWHDEQRLAEGSGTALTVGPRAVVIPSRNVNLHPETDFVGNWLQVARVRFVDPLPPTSKYYQAGFRQGMNRFFLQKFASGWKAQITNAAGTFSVPNVMPHFHNGAAVPGTARWRYTAVDDGMWVPCGQKCCRAQF